jgi:hypothetical protein
VLTSWSPADLYVPSSFLYAPYAATQPCSGSSRDGPLCVFGESRRNICSGTPSGQQCTRLTGISGRFGGLHYTHA